MSDTECRRVGSTELRIACLGLGGSALGGYQSQPPLTDEQADAAYEAAWASGFRYYDTAPRYGPRIGEQRLGRALRDHPRDSFVLSSKVGIERDLDVEGHPAASVPVPVVCDYGYDATLRSVERTLANLCTDRLDLALIHDIGAQTHGPQAAPARFREAMQGAYPALERLRSEGVIQAIGVGVNSLEVCLEAMHAHDFDVFMLAQRYTLLDQSALTELLPRCERRGTSIICAAPFNSGILASGVRAAARHNEAPAAKAIQRKVADIEQVCAAFDVALGAAALQFPLAHPSVCSVLPGARNARQVYALAKWYAQPIPAQFWTRLRSLDVISADCPCPD